ncbi:MAG: exodeoxyribonuclease VII large subunit [Eubacteriales bacterium]|nr:exodeoxyribonuclease VII large subunit [Eubacteriales bacterium]
MDNVFTVTALNKYIKNIFDSDPFLSDIVVKGEISNYKLHYSGHMYFTLKDEDSVIRCVMFKMQRAGIRFEPESGMKVIVRGRVSIYERDGQYQIYASDIQPDGIGALYLAFTQLKEKLEKEGLFDNAIKKPIPFLPRVVGVVTSSTGSVIKDIINVAGRRFPEMNIRLFPVAVQGEDAARQIAHAVDTFNRLACVDVIIVARGGGSLEELWAFNEEAVARSIYRSVIPVISAVGHETDYTIADFAADLRAPTPSAAAEIAVPEKAFLKRGLNELDDRLAKALMNIVTRKRILYSNVIRSTVFRQPGDRIAQMRLSVDNLSRYAAIALKGRLSKLKAEFDGLKAKLAALDPFSILERGYSVVSDPMSGRILKSVRGAKTGAELDVTLSDGKLFCIVDKIGTNKEDI